VACCGALAEGGESRAAIAFELGAAVTSTDLDSTDVVAPASRDEAVTAFGDGSGVTVFGGGTILMPEINYGRLKPDRVVLLRDAGLAGLHRNGSTVTIGAMTTVAELEQAPEPLATAAHHVADHEIRAQATLGGNLCAPAGQTPRGDLQAALIALAATVRSAGKGGERSEAVEDFLADDREARLVLEVELEEPNRAAHASARRPHAHAYTILAACIAETSTGIRVGVTGAASHAIRARAVEEALASGASAAEAAHKVLDDADPQDEALASAWYRKRLLPVIVRRALDDLEGGT
jgi:CO/xanthine dehydrogenase FAD-binding subunit